MAFLSYLSELRASQALHGTLLRYFFSYIVYPILLKWLLTGIKCKLSIFAITEGIYISET